MKNEKMKFLLYILSLVFVISLYVIVYATFNSWELERGFLNSDSMYLPSLYWDLIKNGNSISDWSLNASPNFFPDNLVFFILMKISNADIKMSFFLFSVVQLLIINVSLLFIFKVLSKEYFSIMILSNVMLAFFALMKIFDGSYLIHNIITNSFHLGAFVNSLICLLLVLSILNKPQVYKFFLLGVVCVLSVISDRLFFIEFVVPVIMVLFLANLGVKKYSRETNFLTFLVYFKRKSSNIKLIATVFFSSIIGSKTLDYLVEYKFLFIEKPSSYLNIEGIIPSFNVLIAHWFTFFGKVNFVSLMFLVFFIGLIYMIFKVFRTKMFTEKETMASDFFYLYTIIATIFVLLAPVFVGNYTGVDNVRYNFQSYLFFLMALPYLVITYVLKKDVKFKNVNIGALFFLLILVVSSINRINVKEGLNRYFTFKPKVAIAIDEYFDKTGHKTGTAQYWEAKLGTMFSERGVILLPVFNDLNPFEHVTNKTWFTKNPNSQSEPMEFTFLINSNGERGKAIQKIITEDESLEEVTVQGFKFVAHKPYTYDYKPWKGYSVIIK